MCLAATIIKRAKPSYDVCAIINHNQDMYLILFLPGNYIFNPKLVGIPCLK